MKLASKSMWHMNVAKPHLHNKQKIQNKQEKKLSDVAVLTYTCTITCTIYRCIRNCTTKSLCNHAQLKSVIVK